MVDFEEIGIPLRDDNTFALSLVEWFVYQRVRDVLFRPFDHLSERGGNPLTKARPVSTITLFKISADTSDNSTGWGRFSSPFATEIQSNAFGWRDGDDRRDSPSSKFFTVPHFFATDNSTSIC